MTSLLPMRSETVRPSGTCISLAVVRLYSGIAELPPPLVPHDFDGQRVFARNRVGLEDGPDRRNGDGGQDQRGNDRPDDLDRGVAVGLVRLRISGLTPKAENGVEQHALDQHEHQEGPFDRGVQKVVRDPGEVAAGKQRGLRVVAPDYSRPAPVPAGTAR